MPLPVIAAGLLGQAILHVVTKPWPWLVLIGWFVAAKIDIGVLATETRDWLFRLWWAWVVVLALLVIREYLRLRVAQEK